MVLDLLWAEKSHLSARDIFEKLNNLGRNIGHTSVYQNLEALQSAGVIECLDRASGRLYGYRSDPHSHLTCSATGAIEDLDVILPQELLDQIDQSIQICAAESESQAAIEALLRALHTLKGGARLAGLAHRRHRSRQGARRGPQHTHLRG
jgi:Fur family ferric uptake transcriptional regulator